MFNKKDKNEEELVVTKDPKEIEKENETLFLKLTNKNQDYFVQLDRRLDELSYEGNKKIVVLNQMILETIGFQEDAITARKMYGTVTERSEKILDLDPQILGQKKESSANWMLYMDGALLLGGMFSIVNGFSAWRSLGTNGGTSLSLIQIIMNFVLGGIVAMALTKYKPEPGQTKGMLKYTGVTIAAMLLFVLLMTSAELLTPSVMNPKIPPIFVMVTGAIAIALRWYLKKELDIKGTLF